MNIFVSYRRDDSRDLAGRLADRLRSVPGIREVFLDVDDIAPGADFSARIQASLSRDPVCLLVIGAGWRGELSDGSARIMDERDFVRMEAGAALASGLRVIPVLANDATMPLPTALPDDLQRLPTLNAIPLRHATFDHDIGFMVEALMQKRKPGAIGAYLRRNPAIAGAVRASVGLFVAAIALLLVAVVHNAMLGRSLDDTLGGQGPVWVLIAGVLILGGLAGLLFKSR